MTTFDRPSIDWTRDSYGRARIKPPPGVKWMTPSGKSAQKHRAYTRVTTYVAALDDGNNLTRWKMRRVILGLAARPDYVTLAASLSANDHDKQALNDLAEKCLEAAGPNAADIGTALHGFTERVDRGEPIGNVPPEYRADLEAYSRDVRPHLRFAHIECRMVSDEHQTAGTPDRLGWCDLPDPDGVVDELRVIDVKTGNTDYPSKFASQLAEYAGMDLYDPETGERTPINVNRRWGLIVGMRAGTGTAWLAWLDLSFGTEGVQLAGPVRSWRSRGKSARGSILQPIVGDPGVTSEDDSADETPTAPAQAEQNGNPTPTTTLSTPEAVTEATEAARDAGLSTLESADPTADPDPILVAVAELQDKHQAAALYRQHAAGWLPVHTEAVGLRLAELDRQRAAERPEAALASAIRTAADPGAVTALWRQHHGTPVWTTEHDQLSAARVAELTS